MRNTAVLTLTLLLLASASPLHATVRCPGSTLQSLNVASGQRFELPVKAVDGAGAYYLQRSIRFEQLHSESWVVLGNAVSEIVAAYGPPKITDTAFNTWPGSASFSVYYVLTAVNGFDPAFVPCAQDVLVTVAPDPLLQKDSVRIVIPVAGSVRGASNSTFRTRLSLANRWNAPFGEAGTPLTGRVVFHRSGTSASASDPSLSYSILPNASIVYDDIMDALHADGIGSIDILPDAGESGFYAAPAVRAQLVSLNPGGGAFGADIPAVTMTGPYYGALWSGTFLPRIQILETANKRQSLGVRTLSDTVRLTARLVAPDGTEKATRTRSYPAEYHEQGPLRDWFGDLVAAGDAIVLEATRDSGAGLPGGAIVYLAETDNTTNDVTLTVPQHDTVDVMPPVAVCRIGCSFLTL